HMDINNEEETALPCKFRLYTFQNNSISIYAINFIDNQLVIDASLPALPVDWLPYLGVTATGAETEPREVYNITRCFGQIVARAYMFRARMDLARKKDTQSIRFSVTLLNRSYVMPLTFSKPAARLHASVKESYWLFGGNRLLTCDASGRRLNIRKCSRHELMVTEANYCNAIKHDATLTDDQKQELISLRKDYWEARFSGEKASTPNASRPIWITYDKLYKGGDNGEYLYHYVRDNCPDIDMYYVLSEDSPDYLRLRDDSHVLVHKSRRCKELALRADIILATHVNALRYCGLTETYEDKYLRNLSNGRVVCLQHGLTTQELAIFQNSLFDNTRLYLCASRYEIANLLQPVYGYEESQMRLCGLARYDGLVSRSRKQILITPTWRNYDANGGIAFHKKTHTDYFRQSDYFRIYNTLINDPRLISCAKQYGYRVIFLLHPAMSSQMEDYDRNEYVELVAAAGDLNYEKILTESALMVTDYSGVQFDFAYMRKPVLYYHPEALPPHYPESRFFQYKTMGFGPVLTEHGDLIEQICAYMENDCQMKQEYRDRADDFFAFRDTDSCRRIYEAVADFMKEDDYLQAFQMKKQDALDTLALEDAQEKARDKAQIKALNKALEDARKSNEKLEQQAGALKASWSYRLGHALVLLPGKIKRLLE
ncbi:MAG: CDP-glycerol glycerophosphotransferase family protein, partial [Lachnospiraceae bacterium]|nr:CDP-glycerol glycerophosphotransferase family protein [Lachnospiraceae bacterium]